MILDWDVAIEESKSDLLEKIKGYLKETKYTFLIYETTNGYHGYNISERCPFYNKEIYQEMYKLKCDPWYINFTKYVGFVTRLEKKKDRNENFIEKFVIQINEYPIDNHLKELVNMKDSLIQI